MARFKAKRIVHVYWHWVRKCGWCGRMCAVATDGRNLFCASCKHW